jgi:PII-like signaling protein
MIPDEASLLRLYVNGSLRWHGKPLYQAVVETAREMHLAGASVFLVDLSYGTHRRLRDAKSEYLFVDVPVVIEVVDAPERVETLVERLRPMVGAGFATLEPVRVVRYAHHEDRSGPDAP